MWHKSLHKPIVLVSTLTSFQKPWKPPLDPPLEWMFLLVWSSIPCTGLELQKTCNRLSNI